MFDVNQCNKSRLGPTLQFVNVLKAALDRLGVVGTRLLVGVSGGADSVSLLRGLHALAGQSQIVLHAAHLNHCLRGAASDEDAQWTDELCARLGIPLVVERIDVRDQAGDEGRNLEEAARIARYSFFERTARFRGCRFVAVAHTADDRVETVLHHLLRGTGLAGLRGIRPTRDLADGISLVRPLLGIRRRTIEGWLAEIGQDYRTDATNADESRTRNRIRHSLLPSLERDFGPQVRDALLQLADQAEAVQATLDQLAMRLLDSAIEDRSAGICRLNVGALEGEPRHLVREAFVALWKRQNWPRQAMGFDEWDRLYRLIEDGSIDGGPTINLPGNIEAVRRGTLMVLRRR